MAALIALNFEGTLKDNVEAMEGAASQVETGEITRAVRDAKVDGIEVKSGDIIGLHNNALVPSQSYCDQLTKRDLMFWKSRMLLRFYRAKGRLNHGAGLATSLRQAFSGFRKGEHSTKLQTAFRNGLESGVHSIGMQFRRGWVPRSAEQRMFAPWDAIYRTIHEQKLEQGIVPPAPLDTAELHHGNVAIALRHEHEAPRQLVLLGTAPAAQPAQPAHAAV